MAPDTGGPPAPAGRRWVSCFLGLGANLGDRLGQLQRAVDLLAATAGVRVLAASRVFETEPVGGPPGQPDYLNAVLRVETTLPPRGLLDACLRVEAKMGRTREVRWGPRVVDVDLLTYGDQMIDEPGLRVPHPRMRDRAFVLAPLRELQAEPEEAPHADDASVAGVRPLGALLVVPAPPGGE